MRKDYICTGEGRPVRFKKEGKLIRQPVFRPVLKFQRFVNCNYYRVLPFLLLFVRVVCFFKALQK
jgi:hypothetical protein